MVVDDDAPVLSERLTPSPVTWLLALGVGFVFFLMLFPIGTAVASIAAAISGLATAAWLWSLASRIILTADTLQVGRAAIEVEALGDVLVCDAKQMRQEMGPGSDARSYTLSRPWVQTGIKVAQIDERDPTPYWLFSSRQPEEFADALQRVQQAR